MTGNSIFDTLIFDADDTLWENNIYFEQAIEEYIELLAPLAPQPLEVKRVLNEVEHEFIPLRGYGGRNFIDALHETFRRLDCGTDGQAFSLEIETIGERLLRHPVDPMPGVAVTLAALQERHRMIVFTKGDREEQAEKLDRSGLRVFFERIEVVKEKDTAAYRQLVRRRGLPLETTAMIGNSPRSDVLPALAAGLWAVFIPHERPWQREEERVDPHERLLVTQAFSNLPHVLSTAGARKQSILHE